MCSNEGDRSLWHLKGTAYTIVARDQDRRRKRSERTRLDASAKPSQLVPPKPGHEVLKDKQLVTGGAKWGHTEAFEDVKMTHSSQE